MCICNYRNLGRRSVRFLAAQSVDFVVFLAKLFGEFQPLKELLDESSVNSISGNRYQAELNIKTNCLEHEHVSHYIVEHMNIYW